MTNFRLGTFVFLNICLLAPVGKLQNIPAEDIT